MEIGEFGNLVLFVGIIIFLPWSFMNTKANQKEIDSIKKEMTWQRMIFYTEKSQEKT